MYNEARFAELTYVYTDGLAELLIKKLQAIYGKDAKLGDLIALYKLQNFIIGTIRTTYQTWNFTTY